MLSLSLTRMRSLWMPWQVMPLIPSIIIEPICKCVYQPSTFKITPFFHLLLDLINVSLILHLSISIPFCDVSFLVMYHVLRMYRYPFIYVNHPKLRDQLNEPPMIISSAQSSSNPTLIQLKSMIKFSRLLVVPVLCMFNFAISPNK